MAQVEQGTTERGAGVVYCDCAKAVFWTAKAKVEGRPKNRVGRWRRRLGGSGECMEVGVHQVVIVYCAKKKPGQGLKRCTAGADYDTIRLFQITFIPMQKGERGKIQ